MEAKASQVPVFGVSGRGPAIVSTPESVLKKAKVNHKIKLARLTDYPQTDELHDFLFPVRL